MPVASRTKPIKAPTKSPIKAPIAPKTVPIKAPIKAPIAPKPAPKPKQVIASTDSESDSGQSSMTSGSDSESDKPAPTQRIQQRTPQRTQQRKQNVSPSPRVSPKSSPSPSSASEVEDSVEDSVAAEDSVEDPVIPKQAPQVEGKQVKPDSESEAEAKPVVGKDKAPAANRGSQSGKINVFDGLAEIVERSEKRKNDDEPEVRQTIKERKEAEKKAKAEAKEREKLLKLEQKMRAKEAKEKEKLEKKLAKEEEKKSKGGAKSSPSKAKSGFSSTSKFDPEYEKLAAKNPKDLTEDEKVIQQKQNLIYKIQKYGNSKRFGDFLRKECKFKYDDASLRKLSVQELQFEYAKQESALGGKSNGTLVDNGIKHTAMLVETMVCNKTPLQVKGTVDKCWTDDHFLDLLERVKLKYSVSPLEKMDPVIECSFILFQTGLLMHKQNTMMQGGKTDMTRSVNVDLDSL
jgi:hypothetical protein